MKIYECKLWWGQLNWVKYFLYSPTQEDIASAIQEELDYYVDVLKNTPVPDPTPLPERAIGRCESQWYLTNDQIFYQMKTEAVRIHQEGLEQVKQGLKPHITEVNVVENRSWKNDT